MARLYVFGWISSVVNRSKLNFLIFIGWKTVSLAKLRDFGGMATRFYGIGLV